MYDQNDCGIVFENKNNNDAYWYQREKFNRLLLNKVIPEDFYSEKEKLQEKMQKCCNLLLFFFLNA